MKPTYTLLAVHAHPDDEASGTGGVLRLAANHGHTTVLVTCTNGDLGETKGPASALQPRHNPDDRQRLATLRHAELQASAAILGITHLYTLGYHDSGMHGWETNQTAEAFMQADVAEVTRRLVHIIRHHRPDVVVTYDENGGYGHPDHIMTHQVTMLALDAAGRAEFCPAAGSPWQARKMYYTAWARSEMLRAFRFMHLLGRKTPLRDPHFDVNTLGCPDELITTRIDVRPVMRLKWRALFTHRSQMGSRDTFWWLLRLTGRWLYPYESFRCIRSEQSVLQQENDIFAGLT